MTRLTLRRRIRETWQNLSRIDARPDQIAAGFSIGIAASFLPLNPSPIIVATVVAWLLKRKLILPVQHPLKLDRARLWDVLHNGWDAYAAMLVGSIIIATPVMLLTYLVVNRLAERWARNKNKPQHLD